MHWDNPVPVVAAIVEHEGAVILARDRDWPEKMFRLVTGFLENDETPEQGVAREVKEELADYRRIAPDKLKPWDFGTGLALADWLARRLAR